MKLRFVLFSLSVFAATAAWAASPVSEVRTNPGLFAVYVSLAALLIGTVYFWVQTKQLIRQQKAARS